MASSDDILDEELWPPFQTAASEVGELIRRCSKNGVTEIISHHDADGLAAAGTFASLETKIRNILLQLSQYGLDTFLLLLFWFGH